ncbi:hypothetical protein GUJ93_ZPchr0014g46733 [Zizania palustris]|uniref:Uncharacterized protein n=1 Tax=Zizania palustris TaxID=103762 RepID=A0A8J5SWH0_ZIZPA|nr:hypothetical protein GUJ93_ZPchr0014g46733 [Zizania palustris]
MQLIQRQLPVNLAVILQSQQLSQKGSTQSFEQLPLSQAPQAWPRTSLFLRRQGKIDARVEKFSDHSFVAWEIDVPPGREKSDINRFADDFYIFELNRMTHLQVTSFFPEDFLCTMTNTKSGGSVDQEDLVVSGDPKLHDEDEYFHKKLENFIEQFRLDLPQALLPMPPKVQRDNGSKHPSISSRRSALLAVNNPEGKGTTSLALQVLAKKLGLTVDTPESASQKRRALSR